MSRDFEVPDRVVWPLGSGVLVGVLVLLAALRSPPVLLPESMELVGMGRCMLGLSSPLWCADYELLFWSPGYPLLVAPLAGLLDPLVAGGLVSLGALALAVAAVIALLAPRLGRTAAWSAAALVGSTPAVAAYGMVVDARATGLGLLLAALAVAGLAHSRRDAGVGGAAGVLGAAACLTRPELIVALPLLAGWAGLAARPGTGSGRPQLVRMGAVVGGVVALLGPWTFALSTAEGRLALLPRGIQKVGFALTTVLPERWARQAIGESAARLPLRDAVRAGPWPTDLPAGPGLDPSAGLAWLATHLPDWTPLPILPLAVLGVGAAVATRRRAVLVAVAALVVPSLAAVVALPGRDDLMPMSALLPLVAGVLVVAGCGLGWGVEQVGQRLVPPRSGRRRRSRVLDHVPALMAVGLALVLGAAGRALTWPPSPDNASSGADVAADLAARVPSETPVAAPFGSSLQVHRAGMRWVPWPAPGESARWQAADGPRLALLGGMDDDLGPGDLGLPHGWALSPLVAYGAGATAVVLFEVEPPPSDRQPASSSAP